MEKQFIRRETTAIVEIESEGAALLIEKLFSDVSAAKEDILRQVIEKIEGRPAELLDAKNLILSRFPSHESHTKEKVIYYGFHIGNIDFDISERAVIFTPMPEYTQQNAI